MRISAEEQERNRNRVIDVAFDVIAKKGFRAATMREIARAAGIGEATIYSYFPTKEHLVYAACADVQHQVIAALKALPGFNELSLREQFQQLVETELEYWLYGREFLREVFALTFHSPFGAHAHLAETRALLGMIVTELIDAAIEVGEIPDQPFREIMPRLFWDYLNAVFAYWLTDNSENFDNTTRLVDQTTAIIADVLSTALIGKVTDAALLMLRTLVFHRFSQAGDPDGPVAKIASLAKRGFLEANRG